MKVFLLRWVYTDGYDSGDGVIGIYPTKKGAEMAGDAWLVEEDEEYYTYTIEEMEIHD